MKSILSLSLIVFISLFVAFAQAQQKCIDLFPEKQSVISQAKATEAPTTLTVEKFDQIVTEAVQKELSTLSAKERSELRMAAREQENSINWTYNRTKIWSQMNGSDRLHLALDKENKATKLAYQLKGGAVDDVVDKLQHEFATFEVNFFYVKYLKEDMVDLKKLESDRNANYSQLIATKKKEIEKYEAWLGRNYYTYISIREMLEDVQKSEIENHSGFAKQALAKLQDAAKARADNQYLDYRKLKISDVKDFQKSSPIARKALARKAALLEFWVMLKVGTLSGTVIKILKSIVYTLPRNVTIPWMNSISLSPRDFISEAIGIGEKQHLRDIYLDKIEAVIKANSSLDVQLETMRTLNSLSEKRDELLVLFARIPENKTLWLKLKEHAKSKSESNAFDKDFHARLESAEIQAIKDKEFPLYYSEAGATVLGKVAFGVYSSAYLIDVYLTSHPNANDPVSHTLRTIFSVFGGG